MQRIRAAIRARGLRIEPIGTSGAIRLLGPGVHIVAASLAHLTEQDFVPLNLPDDSGDRIRPS